MGTRKTSTVTGGGDAKARWAWGFLGLLLIPADLEFCDAPMELRMSADWCNRARDRHREAQA